MKEYVQSYLRHPVDIFINDVKLFTFSQSEKKPKVFTSTYTRLTLTANAVYKRRRAHLTTLNSFFCFIEK